MHNHDCDITIVGLNPKKSCEYFCMNCGQLRLSVENRDPEYCGNCNSPKLITGEIGHLNKEELTRKYIKER